MTSNEKLTQVITGRTVKTVHQDGATLQIEFADGSSVQLLLANAGGSVIVRDAQHKFEYGG